MSAIEHRQREQVQHSQADAHNRQEAQVVRQSELCRLPCVIGNGQRTAEVFQRCLADQHAAHHAQCQHRHVPGAGRAHRDGFERAISNRDHDRRLAGIDLDPTDRARSFSGDLRRDLDVQRLPGALHPPLHLRRHARAATGADQFAHLARIHHRPAVDAQHSVARQQAGGCGRTTLLDLPEHRFAVGRADTDALHQCGVDLLLFKTVQWQHQPALGRAVEVAHHQVEALALQHRLRDLPAQVGHRFQVVPFQAIGGPGAHPVAASQVGLLRQAGRHGRSDDRLRFVDADQVRGGIEQHRQQQIGHRPGRHDRAALPQRLAVEGAAQVGRSHGAFALIEHAHVATERQC